MNLPNGYILQNGKYRLTHVVGQGGFGITYKGVWFTEVKGALGTVKTEVPICVKEYFFKDYCYRDNDSQAVKVHSETGKALFDKFKEKLIKEARILSEVHHPYIVNVLEVFEENNTAYIAMEYIAGFSLKHKLEQEGILPESLVLKYVRQIGEALQFVHDKSVLHLDIKPSNILIDKNGNARLIDFGVSKRYDIEQEETSTTMLTLSKGFASIEQYDNEGTQNFSPRPDIYSLGATMYNLLTAKIPTESILRATRPLLDPREVNPAISPKTEAAIIKAMQIVPDNRFGTVTDMLDSLDLPPHVQPDCYAPIQAQPLPANDETTLLYKPSTNGEIEENEETMIASSHPIESPLKKKKRKNKVISTLIAIFALLGSATALFLNANKETKEVVELPLANPEALNDNIRTEYATPERDTSSFEEVVIPVLNEAQDETPAREKEHKEETVKEKIVPEKPTPEVTSTAEIDTRYATLITQGKAKMAQADYAEAKKSLVAAKEMKLTEEVVRLIISCDTRAEEKRIADKKLQYEEKMSFGKYKIVRKKTNGRYGAIDTNAEERIPCKYLSVGKASVGRAFEREDNLFDIYSPEGALVNEGLTYYE